MRHRESSLQINCVRYFRYQYPNLARVFFSVPNGGHRFAKTASWMKKEGQLAGVSDMLLLVPNKNHHGLCIEFKIKPNKQSVAQRNFEEAVSPFGYKYIIVYDFPEFKKEIDNYLSESTFK